jgi:hypothetical protein
MRFEHIIVVNDILNPLVEPLSLDQLWSGLVGSLEDPARFLPGIDSAKVTARTADGFRRELRFGHTVIHDRVHLVPREKLAVSSEATPEVPALTRTLTIEAPVEGEFIVRFVYERRPEGHAPVEPAYLQVLEDAWIAADIDLIAQIRRELTLH